MMKLKSLLLGVVLAMASVLAAKEPATANYTRTEDVVYGRKFGTALTLDVFQPEKSNRCAIFFMVSGGFFSSHEGINAAFYRALLDRGYTVFAVVHGSQPRFIIPEIEQDVQRAVRFVRHSASRWGIDPGKFGVTGASAGGHLSLTLGTQGGPGAADSKDPIDRESSAVQSVACFFPPTDFLNWTAEGDDEVGVGPVGSKFKAAFGPRSDTEADRKQYGREISPFYFVTSNMAPTLIIHGDADKLVPIRQAEIFVRKAEQAGARCKLIRREGKDHGWPEMGQDMSLLADWFDQTLRGLPPSTAKE